MATRSFIRAINDYIDADVLLEWGREVGRDVEEQIKRTDRARRRLQRQLGDAGPADASLVQSVETYLNAHLAERLEGVEQHDHRLFRRTREDLLEKVRASMGQIDSRPAPSGDSASARPIPLTARILVAVDTSRASEWAVDVGGGLAHALDAHVMVLHVVEPLPAEYVHGADDIVEQRRREGTALLNRSQQALPASVDSDQMLSEGEPSAEIISAARVWEADLIVVGTRGRGRFAQLILGSTAEEVIRAASCPVLTVGRQPERFVGQEHHKSCDALLTQP